MRPPLRLSALAVALAAAGPACAMDLAAAWDAARRHDAQYRSAALELESTRQARPIARASLRPSVALQVSDANVTGTREFSNSLNQEVRVPVDYRSPQASLQLRAPVLNYEGLARVRQADAQVEGAEAIYEARGQDLADRVGSAYLQALLANEGVLVAEAEIASSEAQLERARQRLLRGEGTRTEVAQAQGTLELAQVKRLEALDQVELARRSLRRLTGLEPAQLRRLPDDFTAGPPEPMRLQDWLDMAERQNPTLRARRFNLEVARQGIERSRAGHMPRLDLVAGVSSSRNESISSLNQSQTLRSIGVQLSLPLYSGGGVEASVRQSLFDRDRAEEDLRNEREAVQVDLQRYFQSVVNGGTRIEAHRRVVASAQTALEGMTRALAAGLGTQADVLDAQSRRYAAERDLAQARYDTLAARMRLMLLAGVPAAEVVNDVGRLLTVDLQLKTRSPS